MVTAMTREEAIKRIERERDFSRNMEKAWGEIDWKDRPDHLADPRKLSANHREYADALDMAIAALREQSRPEASNQQVTESLQRNGSGGSEEAPASKNQVTSDKTSDWVSVADRLPKEWEDVLVWSKCGFVACALYIGIPGKWRVSWNHEMLEPDTITHWMPLPEPPEVG
jgi:hypothetical protein